jgi:hypothetical protein
MFVASLVFAAAAAGTAPAETFMQRLVDIGYQHKTITVGALPPGWKPPVALPQSVPVLGTVQTPNVSTNIYYQPADAHAAAKAYMAQLKAAGYSEQFGAPGRGGFTFTFSGAGREFTVMCRGATGVSFTVVSPDDLRVNVPAVNAPGVCANVNVSHVTTPVPDLVAPPNTTIQSSGSGVGWGAATSEIVGSTSMRSSAIVRSSLSLKQLMAAFAAQMQRAHWKAGSPFVSPQGASQSFTLDTPACKWSATLMLVRDAGSHGFRASLDANGTGTPATAEPNIAPARPLARLAASQEPAVVALAERIASVYAPNQVPVEIYPRALPPAVNRNIPLPRGKLLGSTAARDAIALFYDVTSAQYQNYVTRLQSNGWQTVSRGMPHAGGFTASFGGATIFCKPGVPQITTLVGENSNALTIHVSPAASRSCKSETPAGWLAQWAPLPGFTAPANATMQPGNVGVPGGNSGARIVSSLPLADLLASFASQMTNANWSASPPLTNDAVGSQTFTSMQNGAQWQAVLTVYRSHSDPKTYYAFIDVTRL